MEPQGYNARGEDYDRLGIVLNPHPEIQLVASGLTLSNITQVPASTANYTIGRLGYRIAGIIIHTVVGSLASADGAFQNPARQASAHYGIEYNGDADGPIHQYVAEGNIAWHCGRFYTDAADPLANCNTIGIEHADNGAFNSPRPDALYVQSVQLVKEICARYAIPIDRTHIRKHKEVADPNNPTACPDSLDIDRIVAMANGTYGPVIGTLTGDDDMLYIGPVHPLAATFKTFAAGQSFKERSPSSPVVANLAVGVSVTVDAYCYSTGPVNCTDLDGKGTQGPDYLWWHAGDRWVPDAILATTPVLPSAPGANIPATEALDTFFATQVELKAVPAGTNGTNGKDGVNGVDGASGKDGVNGTNGVDGLPGINGIDGKNGVDGKDGLPGRDGLPGKDGAPGGTVPTLWEVLTRTFGGAATKP